MAVLRQKLSNTFRRLWRADAALNHDVLMFDNESEPVLQPGEVRAYLVYPCSGVADIQYCYRYSKDTFEQLLYQQRLFFSYDEAERYARFETIDYAVLTLVIPESAVECHGGHLKLTAKRLSDTKIHNCRLNQRIAEAHGRWHRFLNRFKQYAHYRNKKSPPVKH